MFPKFLKINFPLFFITQVYLKKALLNPSTSLILKKTSSRLTTSWIYTLYCTYLSIVCIMLLLSQQKVIPLNGGKNVIVEMRRQRYTQSHPYPCVGRAHLSALSQNKSSRYHIIVSHNLISYLRQFADLRIFLIITKEEKRRELEVLFFKKIL